MGSKIMVVIYGIFGNSEKPKEQDSPKVHNVYHRTAPKDAVHVGRGSFWGNPFVIGKHGTRDEVIDRFCKEILPDLDVSYLKGKDLICYCKPKRCHADYLLQKANKD
jgi:hypothetical protein